MKYQFDWDPVKSRKNKQKHKITFQRATTVFRDPNMIAIFDSDHSEVEDRWITLGMDENGIVLVVSHTYNKIAVTQCRIRMISARKATRKEIKQYEG